MTQSAQERLAGYGMPPESAGPLMESEAGECLPGPPDTRPRARIGRSSEEIDHDNAIGEAEAARVRGIETRALTAVRRELKRAGITTPGTAAAR
jgi:hypothetical protein